MPLAGDTTVIVFIGQEGNNKRVLVFTRTSVVWTQEAELTASDRMTRDTFRGSVDISGDIIIVGASQCSQTTNSKACVFTRTRTTGITEPNPDVNRTPR